MTFPRRRAPRGRGVLAAAIALTLAAIPAVALGHAALVSASPAAGAVLTAPPPVITLVFDGELVPDGSAFTVTDATGTIVGAGAIDLTVADRNQLRGPVTIAEPGTYTVAWTAVSADGHAEPGELTFEYAAPAPGRPAPNTAMPASAQGGTGFEVGVIGVLALITSLAGVVRVRRAERP